MHAHKRERKRRRIEARKERKKAKRGKIDIIFELRGSGSIVLAKRE